MKSPPKKGKIVHGPTPDAATLNPGELMIHVGKPEEQQALRLRFSSSAYAQIEKLTGISHFARYKPGQTQDNMLSLDFMLTVIFATTRKTEPSVTMDWLIDAIDEMPPHMLTPMFGEIIQAFTANLIGPPQQKEAIPNEPSPST